MRTAGAFTKSEIKAAIEAAVDAGMQIHRVEIGADKITIVAGKPGESGSETDIELAEFEGRHGTA
jgi:hypothetical protein